ncbi:hypothetical protein HDV00_007629 [Rhizophlyctis rosea]|nr:hypothetical protein HDV00_007629 [Rhizophlyctis rosea]
MDTSDQLVDDDSFLNLVPDGKLKKKIIRKGHGEPILPKSTVSGYIHPDGPIFDSSRERGSPFDFTIGGGQVIEGWERGIATMKIGEEADLICSPEYAYGEQGYKPTIPPNATLRFNVEVLKADPPELPILERLAKAKRLKEEGNQLVKSGDYESAAKLYENGLQHIASSWGADPPEIIDINALKVALNSNLALCTLKTKDFAVGIKACREGLEIEPSKVKLLFRLGQALAGLGQYADAIEALNTAMKYDPSDSLIPREIEKVRKTELTVKRKEKEMYSKMFGS